MVRTRMGRTETGMPARLPDDQGNVVRDGVRIHWEAYGDPARPAVLLLPTWAITHSRHWKPQIGYLARHFRVVAFDGRGNGLSDRPADPAAYHERAYTADAVAVLDAAGLRSACVLGLSRGGLRALLLAARHPERVDGACVIGATLPYHHAGPRDEAAVVFDTERQVDEGWARYNRHSLRRDYRGFLAFFFAQVFPEPHSTKQHEDCVTWGLDTTAETLIATVHGMDAGGLRDADEVDALCRSIRRPVLAIHGTHDGINAVEGAERIAALTGGDLVRMDGSGHAPTARDPVRVNLLLRDFVTRCNAARPRAHTWTRGLVRAAARPVRVLADRARPRLARRGHRRRAARAACPACAIEWLAQEPVTGCCASAARRSTRPALSWPARPRTSTARRASTTCTRSRRSAGWTRSSSPTTWSSTTSSREEHYDLWVGDEAWEVDHFLHENPELQARARSPGSPTSSAACRCPTGGEREAFLTADYNAEMIEHVERFPRVRDRAVYIGDPDDLVPRPFGPGLPPIRAWTERHYAFAGYVPGYDPAALRPTAPALRAELGYGPEPLCLVAVGGSGVGGPLLRRVVAALPRARELVPGLRMVAVTGPRIDPATLPRAEGLEVRGYVHALHRHLAACDVGVVQGGLTTTMELVAAGRPLVACLSPATSSSASTCAIAWTATAPGPGSTTPTPTPRRSPGPSLTASPRRPATGPSAAPARAERRP